MSGIINGDFAGNEVNGGPGLVGPSVSVKKPGVLKSSMAMRAKKGGLKGLAPEQTFSQAPGGLKGVSAVQDAGSGGYTATVNNADTELRNFAVYLKAALLALTPTLTPSPGGDNRLIQLELYNQSAKNYNACLLRRDIPLQPLKSFMTGDPLFSADLKINIEKLEMLADTRPEMAVWMLSCLGIEKDHIQETAEDLGLTQAFLDLLFSVDNISRFASAATQDGSSVTHSVSQLPFQLETFITTFENEDDDGEAAKILKSINDDVTADERVEDVLTEQGMADRPSDPFTFQGDGHPLLKRQLRVAFGLPPVSIF